MLTGRSPPLLSFFCSPSFFQLRLFLLAVFDLLFVLPFSLSFDFSLSLSSSNPRKSPSPLTAPNPLPSHPASQHTNIPPYTSPDPGKHSQTARQTPFIYRFKRDCMQCRMHNRMPGTDWIHKSPGAQSDFPGTRAISGDTACGRAVPIGGIC